MDWLETLHGRRAVRAYAEAPPAQEQLDAVLSAATWAPSGMNVQPWRFYLVEGRAALKAISDQAKAHALDALEGRPEGEALRGMLEPEAFNLFYDAPMLIIVCAAEAGEMALKDCCLAAATLMLAAHAEGLGTCWIGLAEGWLATPQARAWLGLPEGVRPVAPIIIGVPRGQTASPGRTPPQVVRLRPPA